MPHSPTIFKSLLIGCIILVSIVGCKHYYKATQQNLGTSAEKAKLADSLNFQSRYFILRSGGKACHMKDIILSPDRTSIQFTAAPLSSEHRLHIVGGRKNKMIYNAQDARDLAVLIEVHFYLSPGDSIPRNGTYTLALEKVQKIEVIEKDKKRTTNSYVIGAIGITLTAALVAGIIIAATKSSCPFVSAYEGNEFLLQGEIFGGAVYPQLARHDYLPLNMKPFVDGSLQLKISNELQEHQYTDLLELWIITHDENSRVYADEQGNLSEVFQPQAPVEAWLNQTKDVKAQLANPGDNAMLYMDDTSAADARNELVMKFNRPVTATQGKLLLNLKNSYFLDLLYGDLAKGLGSYYPTYIKQQKSKPAAELIQWVNEQQIPLTVSIKTENGWQKITGISTIGPLATRNIVIPFNLPATSTPITEIKLSSGFMFWEIDHAAMDFIGTNNFVVQKLSPVQATDEANKNVLSHLEKEDGDHLSQPEIGNVATIVFKSQQLTGENKMQSFILHSKGYYEHKRNYQHKPDIPFLSRFKKPNALPTYGLELFKKMSSDRFSSVARLN